LLRQVDAIFVAKALVPPNLAIVKADVSFLWYQPISIILVAILTIPSRHLDAFAAPPRTR
jgi:hypothetical protein